MNFNLHPKVLISSGGTGGHIYTGIAIADAITKIIPKSKILFIGSKKHMEIKKIPKSGYSIEKIHITGGRNRLKSVLGCISLLMEVINSFFLADKILKKFLPNIVIGTGGFTSFPTLSAAIKNGIPILIQEQNAFPGLTNRIFSRYAKKICIAYEEAKQYLPKNKTIVTGNPIRSKILKTDLSKKDACIQLGINIENPVILSIGGSQGSENINNAWMNGLQRLIHLNIQLIWHTGKFIHQIKNNKISHHSNFILMEFIDNIEICYAAADVIVSRAGALTISEICLIRKPYILIPFPWSTDDHQNKNAKVLENQKAALIIKNNEINQKLVDSTIRLLQDSCLKKQMMQNMIQFGKPNATKDIVNEILHIIL
ncbi:undecaprenyldiphospho-muramoylpentapeptide beta-N-acetylglucosaminyltransferase [Blattabacterium cuenoti]|uniref:undecaprenyldiphospho-muramoylpentapeptide beta-N-acetylglucosaminyltransferase n=1 Tax=Blattabacterium cuenoti TaxID=1653831 RepID=UPI00163C82B5|nr:undecaprenyldiphospho-muramoylpentapeptide beta-N-acetylglucosaminyltransferase [Blattabacterium cuenoti]